MDNYSINIYIGTTQSNCPIAKSAADATSEDYAYFDSIVKTWASFIPEDYKEIAYKYSDIEFKYTILIRNSYGDIKCININWVANSPEVVLNSTYYADMLKGLSAFRKLLSYSTEGQDETIYKVS